MKTQKYIDFQAFIPHGIRGVAKTSFSITDINNFVGSMSYQAKGYLVNNYNCFNLSIK